jgi:hypothetical protein
LLYTEFSVVADDGVHICIRESWPPGDTPDGQRTYAAIGGKGEMPTDVDVVMLPN